MKEENNHHHHNDEDTAAAWRRQRRRRLALKLNPDSRKRRAKQLTFVEDLSFLHLGKAGGGTIQKRIVRLGYNAYYEHPKPTSNEKQKYRRKIRNYLINLRDPIDRFLSNFYWSGLILCYKEGNDTRIPMKKGLHQVESDPGKNCRSNVEQEAAMIHGTYQGNAEQLALGLCNSDLFVRKRAEADMRLLAHAQYSITDWIDSLGEPEGTTMVGIVLEEGYDYNAQIDNALVYALEHSQSYSGAAEEQSVRELMAKKAMELEAREAQKSETKKRQQEQEQEDKEQSLSSNNTNATATIGNTSESMTAPQTVSSHGRHSSRPPDDLVLPKWVQTMQAHRTKGLSDEAFCCLASTFYRRDYALLVEKSGSNSNPTTPLGEKVCHGPSQDTCREALLAIARRHSSRNCQNYHYYIENDQQQHEELQLSYLSLPFGYREQAAAVAFSQNVLCLVFVGILGFLFKGRKKKRRRTNLSK